MENLFKDLEKTSRILSRVPGFVLWKHPDARFMCANQRAIANMGFADFAQMSGCYPRDMKSESSKMHDRFVENTRYVIEHQCSVINVFSLYLASGRWSLHIGEENRVVGRPAIDYWCFRALRGCDRDADSHSSGWTVSGPSKKRRHSITTRDLPV